MGAAELEELIDALHLETRSTEVVWIDLYPDYALISVPERPGSRREVGYLWLDRTLSSATGPGIDDAQERFDLAAVDTAIGRSTA